MIIFFILFGIVFIIMLIFVISIFVKNGLYASKQKQIKEKLNNHTRIEIGMTEREVFSIMGDYQMKNLLSKDIIVYYWISEIYGRYYKDTSSVKITFESGYVIKVETDNLY